MTDSSVRSVVMRRVHTVHAARPFLSAAALSAYVFALALWGIGREVWVARVIENMPSVSDVAALSRFLFAAFTHTHLAVQALSLVALFALVWMVVDGIRTLASATASSQRFA